MDVDYCPHCWRPMEEVEETLERGDLKYHNFSRVLSCGDEKATLSPAKGVIITILLKRGYISKAYMCRLKYELDAPEKVLQQYILHLRRILVAFDSSMWIKTVHGEGYSLIEDPDRIRQMYNGYNFDERRTRDREWRRNKRARDECLAAVVNS